MPYNCGVEVALDLIGGKWSVVIVSHLKEQELRYGELRRRIPGISEKMLTQRLRDLTAQALVLRTDHGGVPAVVSYRLSAEGEALRPALVALHEWGLQAADRRDLEVLARSS